MSDRRVLLVDDHLALVQLLEPMFEQQGFEVVGTATGGDEAVALVQERSPHLVLMDLNLERGDGVTATRRITAEHPDVRIVVYTFHSDAATTTAALQAGAAAFLAKGATSIEEIFEIVEQVLDGDTDLSSDVATAILESSDADTAQLTPRELEVLHAYATGAPSQKQVAVALGISRKTVENHLGSVYRKLDATSQLDAVLAAVRRGIIDLTPGGPLHRNSTTTDDA
jgi:DNA-binding NarL/FixJ family response regulator